MAESTENEVPNQLEGERPVLPVTTSSNVSETLLRLWSEQPEAQHDVVVILKPAHQDVEPATLAMKSFEQIPYQPRMLKGTMCGADLLVLVGRSEVEAVVPDEEVGVFETETD